jgi:hypothetical protein
METLCLIVFGASFITEEQRLDGRSDMRVISIELFAKILAMHP